MTFEVFKFCRSNPTGRWRLDLSNRSHRALFLRIVDLNTEEAYYSRDHSGRDDTSQKVGMREDRMTDISVHHQPVMTVMLHHLSSYL